MDYLHWFIADPSEFSDTTFHQKVKIGQDSRPVLFALSPKLLHECVITSFEFLPINSYLSII